MKQASPAPKGMDAVHAVVHVAPAVVQAVMFWCTMKRKVIGVLMGRQDFLDLLAATIGRSTGLSQRWLPSV
jgi:hypothetical protein